MYCVVKSVCYVDRNLSVKLLFNNALKIDLKHNRNELKLFSVLPTICSGYQLIKYSVLKKYNVRFILLVKRQVIR